MSVAHALGTELATKILGQPIPPYARLHRNEWAGRDASGKINNKHYVDQVTILTVITGVN
jgi:hypothetical protein